MKKKPLPIGIDDFEMLITRGYYFVDKTLFIKELLDKKGFVNLFTRPRRFGKTLNMSMLQYFFEDARNFAGKKTEHATLFLNLKIMECQREYLQHMGKYPVIFLSLKSAKQEDFTQAFQALADDISSEFARHAYVLESACLTSAMKKKYKILMEGEAKRTDYNQSLKFLSECLHRCHNQKVIILIDEYDVPLESAYLYHYYPQMVSFISSLFESVLKTNPHLEFSVITGCLRISRESIFTGLNNLDINTILSKNYDEYFGFTEAEMMQLCRDYGMAEKYDLIREWYNGYLFGDKNIYNPWSVVCYIKDLLADIDEFPSAYWANTSSNNIVRKLIDRADQETKTEIEELIEGKAVEKPIHEDITYEEIYETMDNLWNFMFFTGYFRKEREMFDHISGERYLWLTIPNEEIRYIFRNKVRGWFREQVQERDRSRFFQAFIFLDKAAVQEEIEFMLRKTIRFHDAYESFYHGFLAGILYGMEDYAVKSNREGGKGRTDLFIKPVSRKKTAFVIEFKIADTVKELGKKTREALIQIRDRMYENELLDEGYFSVVWYGIAFCGKDCEVEVVDGGKQKTELK